ncbi:MAG: hypothetical protein F6K35_40300 [Okeania sp. SIO2H7]|nr:hypothetical protein [Okeania sp. SIO2H7]
MPAVSLNVGEHQIELITSLGGKETITYDGKVVSQKQNHTQFSSLHSFEVEEKRKIVRYEMKLESQLSGVLKYSLKRDRVTIKRGTLPSLTRFILRLFLCLVSVDLLLKALALFIFINAARVTLTESPILLFAIVFYLAFGLIYLGFGLFLKQLLPKNIWFLTVVLWIQIIISSADLLYRFFYQIRTGNIVRGLPSLLVGACIIWLLWLILENCQAVAKELKLK